MLVRELFARLGLQIDSAGFEAAEALFSKTSQGFARMGALAAAAAAGIAGAIGTAAARAGDVSDLAARTGVAAETLQSLDFGAKLAGVEIGELAQSFGFLSRSVAAAARGSGEAQKAWAAAGVSIHDSSGGMKSADALLLELADKFQGMPEGVEKTALAMQLLGRSGAGMLPFLNQGSKAIAELRAESRELGAVMGDETIAAGDALGDNIGRLMEGLKGLRNLIVGPIFKPMADFVEGLVQWMRANNKLIAAKVTPWLKALGRGLSYIADIAAWAIKTFGGWALAVGAFFAAWKAGQAIMSAVDAFGKITTAVKLAVTSLKTMTMAELQAAAAGALIPLIWIAIAAAAVLAYDEVQTFFRGGDTLLGRFGEKWTRFLDDFFKVDNDDWWVTRKLKEAIQAVLDLEATFQKGKISPVRYDPTFKPSEGAGLPTQGLVGAAKRALGFEIAVNWEAMRDPAAAFGGGASPVASVANSPGRPVKSQPGPTNVTVGNIYVQGTESPAETADLTKKALETNLDSVSGGTKGKR